jgi:branched-chain amino acid transport system permease protein
MATKTRFNWGELVRFGLIASVITALLAAVGLVKTFGARDIIGGVISVGYIFLFGIALGAGFMLAQHNARASLGIRLLGGILLGLLTSILPLLLVVLTEPMGLRRFLLNLSPDLIAMMTFGRGMAGLPTLALAFMAASLIGVLFALIPGLVRRAVVAGLIAVFLVGLLSETIILSWGNQGLGLAIRRIAFAARGLSPLGALILFALVAGLNALWNWRGQQFKESIQALPPAPRQGLRWGVVALGILVLLFLPVLLRSYLTEVINNVGLYILMGLGLNIVVGFAGLLDLGYVAFYAIGAYTMGILTSTGQLGLAGLTWWEALPIAVLMAITAGVILGVPVLRMRGDYLAIVTLGFGEIIRILATSDFLAPLTGGPQGVLQIPNVPFFGMSLIKPEHLYYLILAGCLLAFFVSWRLRDSRMGRQWMAMREDEDVAEAMGINLVKTKLLAFATGAAFSGLSGTILAAKLNSVFPHSMSLYVSINVLCLIIIGGMGSLPGVIVGALLLIGLPELLREFAEYRMLMYGVLLILIMLSRPEGFWPSEVAKRELHAREEVAVTGNANTAG